MMKGRSRSRKYREREKKDADIPRVNGMEVKGKRKERKKRLPPFLPQTSHLLLTDSASHTQ